MITQKKTYYKYEVAAFIGISKNTFSRWINHNYYEKLTCTGYSKNQKYLTWPQILILNAILDFLE